MKLANRNILIISNEPWGDVWFSKHHYTNELSKKNILYFLNPPLKWKFSNLFLNTPTITSISNNLYLISYFNILPLTGLFDTMYAINDWIIGKILKKTLQKQNLLNPVFWSFDPYRLINPKKFNPLISIYQSMDMYNCKREDQLAKNVDLILTVSKKIADKFNKIDTPAYIIPHGVSEHNFTIQDLASAKTKNTILLIGSIGSRIDFKLLNRIASSFPNYILEITGPLLIEEFSQEDIHLFEKLKHLSNVIFAGAVPYKDLSEKIVICKLAICVYKQNLIGNMLNSLKIKQYLSYGKNTVTTYLEELKDTADKGIIGMSNDYNIFINLCEIALTNQPSIEKIKERIDYTKGFTYPKLIENIESLLEK